MRLSFVLIAAVLAAGTLCQPAMAQHHTPPHHTPQPPVQPPQPPSMPPVTPPAPVRPPSLQPKPPVAPRDDAQVPEQVKPNQPEKVKTPAHVYLLGDEADIRVFAEPPEAPSPPPGGWENFCNWECLAKEMFPDAENPYTLYRAWSEEQYRIREQRYKFIQSGQALPKSLRLGLLAIKVKSRLDENGMERFYVTVEGRGKAAVFSVSADDIVGGFKDNRDKLAEVAKFHATDLMASVEWNQKQADHWASEGQTQNEKRALAEVDRYKEYLGGYDGPFVEPEKNTGLAERGPVVVEDPGPGVQPGAPQDVVPTPDLSLPTDPAEIVDPFAVGTLDTDGLLVFGGSEPGAEERAPITMSELIDASRDFGGGEVMIDIDVVDSGGLDVMIATVQTMVVEGGLAVAGAVNPVAGVTIAFGRNAKQTYDYAISRGLSIPEAIAAATAGGAVGGAESYVMGMGVGKVAKWLGPAFSKTATDVAAKRIEDVTGTVGNASGFSLVGNVRKDLVDRMVATKKEREQLAYRLPDRTPPPLPQDTPVTYHGGGPWHANTLR